MNHAKEGSKVSVITVLEAVTGLSAVARLRQSLSLLTVVTLLLEEGLQRLNDMKTWSLKQWINLMIQPVCEINIMIVPLQWRS